MGKLFSRHSSLEFISYDKKLELATEGTEFFIDSLTLSTKGQYGAQWILTVTICGEDAEQCLMGFPSDEHRDQVFNQVSDEIAHTVCSYGPCRLYEVPSKKKGFKPYIGIEDVPDELL
jgi:hypothetical protein